MRVHFIAIGGSAMHNLALALHQKDYIISGSDDEVFEPSKSRLESAGLLPDHFGWFPEKITNDIDAVILGMHARADNPELLRAKELGLKIFSYPEFLYEQSKNKTRIVIGGSHGKTTITSMILHILKEAGVKTDFMVGAQIEGFDVMVKLSDDAKYMVIEGDEYLTSPIDPRPKFHLYKPHLAVLSGIAWDHYNVFPDFDFYLDQFRTFIGLIENNGTLFYSAEDPHLASLAAKAPKSIHCVPYSLPEFKLDNGETYLCCSGRETPLKIFGRHNLLNLMAAFNVCRLIGLDDNTMLSAAASFKGAANRLELIAENKNKKVFRDFAHSPSKVKATVQALTEQYHNNHTIAVLELHTFSSLNMDFIPQYKDTMNGASVAFVYFNPHALQMKKLPDLDKGFIYQCFGKNVEVFDDVEMLKTRIHEENKEDAVFLLMSSGNFNGMDMKKFATRLISE